MRTAMGYAALPSAALIRMTPRLIWDGDGLSDFYEIRQTNSDPDDADSDDDGLCDGQELLFGTDPNRSDSDGDGLHDGRGDFCIRISVTATAMETGANGWVAGNLSMRSTAARR